MKPRMAALMRTRTRDEWCALLEGTDACFAPVLDPGEAPDHPHIRARGTFTEVGGVVQPAPGAPVQPDARRPSGTAAGTRRAHRRGPGGLGVRARGDRLRCGTPGAIR